MSDEPVSYADIRGTLQTGDLVLYAGTRLVSRIIRFISKSKWSHVGMVVATGDHDIVLAWESTTASVAIDVEAGAPISGVQLVSLSTRVNTYPGLVAVRRLDVERTDAMLAAFAAFRAEVKGRSFDYDIIEMLKAAYDGNQFVANREDLSALFCSELIAETYQRMGLLDETTPSNEYTPRDFSSEATLTLLGGATLGPEIFVRRDA